MKTNLFALCHNMSILSNITQEQLSNHSSSNLSMIFDPKRVVTRDKLLLWEEELQDSQSIINELKRYFDPWWSFPRLREDQIDALRAIIHPEIIISVTAEAVSENENNEDASLKVEDTSLKVLDLKQEENARNIGSGHRIIYGVAGSGKTVLLVARARLIAQQSPDSKILFLCFNVSLSFYLKSILSEHSNITVLHFDGWAKVNGASRQKIGDQLESADTLGEKLLATLEKGTSESGKYDLVLIDEAQDFSPSWFKCALEAMKEPNDGDLIIVGDGSQGLYQNRGFSWKDIGINAQGRTLYKKFDLDKNYRNSREILELAALFANENGADSEDGIASLMVDPSLCMRSIGIRPILLKSNSIEQEHSKVINTVRDLLTGEWFGKKVDKLQPKDIGIFYRILGKRKQESFRQLLTELEEFTQVVWLTKQDDSRARTRVNENAIKVQTIHSAKGLQYSAVIIIWFNDMPLTFGDSSIEIEKRLCYVAMTRAETYLVISTSSQSEFVEVVENSGKVDFK